MKRRGEPETSGGIVLWKPVGITSRQALEEAQRRLGLRHLGHTGTLDPLASGVLVVVGGEARKFQHLLMSHRKEYVAEVRLGIRSGSDDGEGPLWCPWPRAPWPDRERVELCLSGFRGGYDQLPPTFSAVRVQGERSHRRARRGEPVELSRRLVKILELELVRCEIPSLALRVVCGAGTYLRSLARDLGDELRTGAYLEGLERRAACGFQSDEAVPLESVSRERWRSTEELLEREPSIELDADDARRLGDGQPIPSGAVRGREGGEGDGPAVAWREAVVVGLVEVRGGIVYPKRWLATAR